MINQSVVNGFSKNKVNSLELGYVVCKRCSSIIATLPTNRVQRFYSECSEGCETELGKVEEFD